MRTVWIDPAQSVKGAAALFTFTKYGIRAAYLPLNYMQDIFNCYKINIQQIIWWINSKLQRNSSIFEIRFNDERMCASLVESTTEI